MEKNIVKQVLDKLHISDTTTRVGFILYGKEARTALRLNTYRDATSLKRVIDSLRNSGDGNRVDKAFTVAQTNLFLEENGARIGVPKTLIVLMNNKADKSLSSAAQNLKDSGVKVIVIGVGQQVNEEELKSVAGEKDVYVANQSEDIGKIVEKTAETRLSGRSHAVM